VTALGLGPTDFVQIFTTIFADVQTVRAARDLPPLVSAHLGQEQMQTEESPPRIVVVPTHNEYAPVKRIGVQPMTSNTGGGVTAFNPRPFTFGVVGSKPTSGATSRLVHRLLRRSRTSGTRSTRRWSLSASSSEPSCETLATIRRFDSETLGGVSLRTCSDLAACSCYRLPLKRLSPTSLGRRSFRRRSTSTCRWAFLMAPQPIKAPSLSLELEVF
jgi:hypothetical protein